MLRRGVLRLAAICNLNPNLKHIHTTVNNSINKNVETETLRVHYMPKSQTGYSALQTRLVSVASWSNQLTIQVVRCKIEQQFWHIGAAAVHFEVATAAERPVRTRLSVLVFIWLWRKQASVSVRDLLRSHKRQKMKELGGEGVGVCILEGVHRTSWLV